MTSDYFVSKVSQESLLRQAVHNTSQSIELLREAVSNSVDAKASTIDVKLTNVGGEIWNIVIQDDGNGMGEKHMRAFFNAGDSEKDFPQTSIGEKGLRFQDSIRREKDSGPVASLRRPGVGARRKDGGPHGCS